MDFRWGRADINRMRALARELVGLQPDIILATSTVTTVALQQERRTIPIVFASVSDPVATGIVARLDRPGGNTTGFVNLEASLGGKWLELLSEIAPGLKRAAIMFNPDAVAGSIYVPSFEAAAVALKVASITALVHNDAEIETAIIALGREPGGGLVVMPGGFLARGAHSAQIISAAREDRRVASLKGLLVDAARWNVDREADVAPIRALLDQGCDLEADVVPTVARTNPRTAQPVGRLGIGHLDGKTLYLTRFGCRIT